MHFFLWTESRRILTQLEPGSYEGLKPLPYDHAAYFQRSDETILVELSRLAASRARSKGIINANIFMMEAASGLRPKRMPVDVEEMEGGQLVVMDGNSTFLNAVISNWPDLPCQLRRKAE